MNAEVPRRVFDAFAKCERCGPTSMCNTFAECIHVCTYIHTYVLACTACVIIIYKMGLMSDYFPENFVNDQGLCCLNMFYILK